MPETNHLEEAEMVLILEDLARNSESATAQIAAMKMLLEMRGKEKKPDTGDVMDAPPRKAAHLRAV